MGSELSPRESARQDEEAPLWGCVSINKYAPDVTHTIFQTVSRRVLLGNWLPAYRSAETTAKGMKLRLSEVAEFARLEPLQYQIKGIWLNASTPRERMLHGNDCE